MSLDRDHLPGDPGEDGRGIAGAGPDLEHMAAGRHPRRRDHQRDDIRLGDGLARLDRQRPVLIGELAHRRGDEGLARHLPHGGEQRRIAQAPAGDLLLHHRFPQGREIGHGRLLPPAARQVQPVSHVAAWPVCP